MTHNSSPIVGEDEMVYRMRYYVPRPNPSPIPTPNIFDEPLVGFCINAEWAVHFRGVMQALDQPDTWIGTDEEVFLARQQLQEAFVKLTMECNMCCEEELELIQELVDLSTTQVTNLTQIVTHLTTMITNQNISIVNETTVIEQNTQNLISTATNIYNNQVINNTNIANYNAALYDGTPQSISPTLGANFNDTGGDDALCGAVKNYIEKMVSDYTARVNLAAFAATVTLGAATAFFTIITGGAALPAAAVAWGFLSTSAIGVSNAIWNAIAVDSNAKQKVYCCMFEALKDQPITRETFMSAVSDCGFDPSTPEGRIAGLIQNESGSEGNYLAFLRGLGLNIGNALECDCCAVRLIPVNNCTITPLGDCTWRIYQANIERADNDPFCSEYNYFFAEFKDEFDRCITVNGVSGTAGAGWQQTDCEDVVTEGVGGGGGDGKLFRWWSKACPPDETVLDIIVSAVLVP